MEGLAGQRHRDQAARRSREAAQSVAEIGPPPKRNDERWERYRLNLFAYMVECFPQTTGLSPLSEDHRKIIERTQQAILEGGLELFIVFRGFAKSTITENAATWAAGYGHRKFFVPIGATDEMARTALDSIQYEFETNDHLMEIFPEACHAARALEGVPQRAGKQTVNGERTHIEWSSERCVLPTVEGFAGSGAIIWPKGITAKSIRGMRFKRADGQQARPDFVMGDDLQTDESAASDAQTRKRLATLTKTIMRLGGHTRKMAMVVNATIIEPDDMIDQLADPKKHAAWRTVKVPMLKQFAEAHETHWLGKYADIRTSYSSDDDDDRKRAEADANKYYREHRKEMDAGAVATWESCYDHENEISAIQHAYNILIDTGEDAFLAECQNTPTRNTSGLELLTPDQICAKQSDFPRGTVPPGCNTLTAFVDVHPGIMYWQVWAWEPNFSGYMIDSGTFPEQRRKYFAHRSITRRLKHLYPGFDAGATVTAGLNSLLHGDDTAPGLMRREWMRVDGVPHRIRSTLVDANGEFRDVIVRVLTASQFKASLHPSYGKGITARMAPIAAWPQTREQRVVGPEWVFTKARAGEVPGIIYDTNYWKMRFHRALALPKGSQGALSLYKAHPTEHRRIADHWSSELPTEVAVGSRIVNEFRQKPNTDNHDFDCAVGSMVAASRCGVSNVSPPPVRRRKSRRTRYYD